MEKSKVGTSRKDRDEARESKVQSDLQEETTFFNEQISIQKLQTRIKELEDALQEIIKIEIPIFSDDYKSYGYQSAINDVSEIAEQVLNNPKQK